MSVIKCNCGTEIARRKAEEELYNEFPFCIDVKYTAGSADVQSQYDRLVDERMKEHPLYNKAHSGCKICMGFGSYDGN
jgi:hypothetical protein